ncbi:hypothetical protein [Candidatus Korobacter versatilis]|uniref:hypothetical protein n=1 Tax=Candidatus Korobacter versatilis TaxID=658062 RepID=UPI0005A49E34|nr:hypothetical protein [Candidatus Koribacter versatilis]
MKQNRCRRHLRPRPSRSQINQQVGRVCSAIQALQLEALIELQKPAPSLPRLQFLNRMIDLAKDEVVSLEKF